MAMENQPKFAPNLDLKNCVIGIDWGEGESVTIEGRIVIQGKFVHVYGNKVIKPQEPETEPIKETEELSSGITSVLDKSSLVRLLYEGKVVTAAITHITSKCWRLFNMEFGWCWIPKNVLKWSPAVNMFCITESSYFPIFRREDCFCTEYPSSIGYSEKLVDELYGEES